MSFFNKMLASVGIGSAQIDTLLEKNSYFPGEAISGVVQITGGSVDQTVDKIYIKVMTEYIKEVNDSKQRISYTISQFRVTDSLQLKAQQKLEIPFSFTLPLETPLTFSRQPVWLHTGLDISSAVDPTDKDYIEVTPTPFASILFGAVEQLGFSFKHSTCEHDRRFGGGVPFVQEIEFYPGGEFRGRLKELELVLRNGHEGLSVLVEVDRKSGGFSGWLESALDIDERKMWLQLSREDLNRGTDYVAGLLSNSIYKGLQ